MVDSFTYTHKLLLVGDTGVGKTSLFTRFAEDKFNMGELSTIGVDFKFKHVEIDNKTCTLQLWDTAGQERFKTIVSSYYRGAGGIIIVFDLTDEETFLDIETWMNEIERYANEKVFKLLVGNKSDLMNKRQVSSQRGKELADRYGMDYIETSAKNSHQVDEAFLILARKIHRSAIRTNPAFSYDAQPSKIVLEHPTDKVDSVPCCGFM